MVLMVDCAQFFIHFIFAPEIFFTYHLRLSNFFIISWPFTCFRMLCPSTNMRFSFSFFCCDSFNSVCFVLCFLFFIIVIISIVIFISTIILAWTITGFWLTRSGMVATLSMVYLNLVFTIDLRFTIIQLFIMAVICEVIIVFIFLVISIARPFCKLNAGLR